jgi:hypothetical protein
MSSYIELRRYLAERYAREGDARVLGDGAHIDLAAVNFQGSALAFWDSLLNQARLQAKIRDLTDQILQDPHPSGLDDLVHDFLQCTDAPDLDLHSAGLDANRTGSFSSGLETFPASLLPLLSASGIPDESAFDSMLRGAKTQAAKQALVDFRSREQARIAAVARQLADMGTQREKVLSEIGDIKNSYAPTQPTEPRYEPLSYISDQEQSARSVRSVRYAQYLQSMEDYRQNLDAYNRRRNSLPDLEKNQKEIDASLRALDLDLQNIRFEFDAQQRTLVADVAKTRDSEIVQAIIRMTEGTNALLYSNGGAAKGFVHLLAEGHVLDFFLDMASEAGSKNAVINAFATERNSIDDFIGNHALVIADGCLSVLSSLKSALNGNESLLRSITDTLGHVDQPGVAQAIARLTTLLKVDIALVPPYDQVILPGEINKLDEQFAVHIGAMQGHAVEIQPELADSSALALSLARIRSEVDGFLDRMRLTGEACTDLLQGASVTWSLILGAYQSSQLGPLTKRLCRGLAAEAQSRLEQPADQFIEAVRSSQFARVDAATLVGGHAVTAFYSEREKLRDHFIAVADAIKSFEAARIDLQKLPDKHKREIEKKLHIAMTFSALPLINVLMSAGILNIFTKFKLAMVSGHPAYASLRRTFRSKILISIGIYLALFTVGVAFGVSGSATMGQNVKTGLIAALVTYAISAAILIVNLVMLQLNAHGKVCAVAAD